MTAGRTYGESCAAAHALDLVGERWALLVVRELLLGPKRFTDLRAGIVNASPNVLSQRLRELELAGIVRRRTLPPPAASRVYELTEWGHELEPVMTALGRWGSRSQLRDPAGALSADSAALAQRSLFDEEAADGPDTVVGLRLGSDSFAVRIAGGELDLARGEPADADATIETDPATYGSVVLAQAESVEDAVADGRMTVDGDGAAVDRLRAVLRLPELAPVATPG